GRPRRSGFPAGRESDHEVGRAFQPDAHVGRAFQPDAVRTGRSRAGKPDLRGSEVGRAFQPDADRTGSDGVGLESPTYEIALASPGEEAMSLAIPTLARRFRHHRPRTPAAPPPPRGDGRRPAAPRFEGR